MKNKILLICIALLVLSCTKNEPKNDNSNVEVIDLNDYLDNGNFDSSKYRCDGHVIPLETNEDCLIDKICNVFFSDNRIYIKIRRQNQLLIFDFDGKYINKINIGNGKGDVTYLYDAIFDNQKNELVVGDHGYLKFYTPDGEFIREQEFKLECPVYSIVSTKDGFILSSDYGRLGYEDMPNATMLYFDKEWNVKAAYLNQVLEDPTTTGTMLTFQYNNLTDVTTLNLAYTDTIYHFANEKLEAKYVLDYSSQKIDTEKCKDADEFWKETSDGRLYYYGEYLETSTHQYFAISGNPGQYYYRDKKNKKIIGGEFDFNKDSPLIFLLNAVYNDSFVSHIIPHPMGFNYKASDFLSQEEVDKLNNMKPDDNPALIFFKLKEFNEEE